MILHCIVKSKKGKNYGQPFRSVAQNRGLLYKNISHKILSPQDKICTKYKGEGLKIQAKSFCLKMIGARMKSKKQVEAVEQGGNGSLFRQCQFLPSTQQHENRFAA